MRKKTLIIDRNTELNVEKLLFYPKLYNRFANYIFYDSFCSLLLRQYNSVGELMNALEKTYVISQITKKDVALVWDCLSKVRALLPVQMSQEEEELMRERLWYEI